MPDLSTPIVFIGPMAAGKPTLSKASSREPGLRCIPLDVLRLQDNVHRGMDFLDSVTRDRSVEDCVAEILAALR